MENSRIKDLALAKNIDQGELDWLRHITPITNSYCQKISKRNYEGKKLACWMHITFNTVPMLLALKEAGVEVTVGACNLDSTSDDVAAYLVSKGLRVFGWRGMDELSYQQNLESVRQADADYLCDMGGELSVAYLDRTPTAKGALEATTSGLHLLKKHALSFPVFDWNSIPLKTWLENRFHVGDGLWPAFSHVTSMSLFGRRILIIGYGPVGKGIAERARNLGGIVQVADISPTHALDARYHGCEVVSLDKGLENAGIIVTATGVEPVLKSDHLSRLKPGAIVLNAGHSNREIDIDWLYTQPHKRIKKHIERFNLDRTHFYLLAKGSLLNLAADAGAHGVDMFDHYTAVMLLGITWMFNGVPKKYEPGLHLFPEQLEREIAELSIKTFEQETV